MYALLPLLFVLSGCSEKEEAARPACGQAIVIGDVLVAREFDHFTLLSSSITDRCLEVTIAATGCSSQDWKMDLFTFGEVAESVPTQTSARLLFDDGLGDGDITCQALVEATYYFDLTPYLTDDVLPTEFSLVGQDKDFTLAR